MKFSKFVKFSEATFHSGPSTPFKILCIHNNNKMFHMEVNSLIATVYKVPCQ